MSASLSEFGDEIQCLCWISQIEVDWRHTFEELNWTHEIKVNFFLAYSHKLIKIDWHHIQYVAH